MALSPLAATLQMQQPINQRTPTQVAPTDVVGAYTLATNAANQQYLAKLQQQNAMYGGLAGIGSAGILTAPKLYSALNPATAAATTGATTSAAGTPLSLLPGAAATAPSDALDATMLGYGGDAAGAAGTGAAADAAGTAGADAAGSVAADLGGTAATDAAGGAGADALATLLGGAGAGAADATAADGTAMTLADLLPFLFA